MPACTEWVVCIARKKHVNMSVTLYPWCLLYYCFRKINHLVPVPFVFILWWKKPCREQKLLGNFYNNRRSAANSLPRFTYSFVFLMLRQYYLSCDLYSANRRSAADIKKIPENFVLAVWICPASPIGRASVSPLCLLMPNAKQRQ